MQDAVKRLVLALFFIHNLGCAKPRMQQRPKQTQRLANQVMFGRAQISASLSNLDPGALLSAGRSQTADTAVLAA